MKVISKIAIVGLIFSVISQARSDDNLEHFRGVAQKKTYYCGPANAEAILSFWGLSGESLNSDMVDEDEANGERFQNNLARMMDTSAESGTTPRNWLTTMNSIITTHNLNQGRQYSITPVNVDFSDSAEFYTVVTRSLIDNVPVVLGFFGRTPDTVISHDNLAHFITIIAVTGTAFDATYHFLETLTGEVRTFRSNFISNLFSTRQSYLLAHVDSTAQLQLAIERIRINIQPRTACGSQSHLCIANQLNLGGSNRGKRAIEKYVTCPNTDILRPFFTNVDLWTITHYYFYHNTFHLELSMQTAIELNRVFYENTKENFHEYVKKLVNQMRSVGRKEITTSDYHEIANFIFDGMSYIHDKTLQMMRYRNGQKLHVFFSFSYKFFKAVDDIGIDKTIYLK